MENMDFITDDEARYEDMFLSILQREEKIEPFLDKVFKFLYRRTDFFLRQETEKQSYGFLPGASKEMVSKIFNKYDSMSKEKLKQKLLQTNGDIVKSEKLQNKVVTPEKVASTKPALIESSNLEEKLKREQELFQGNATSYNGAIRANYSWTQTIKDIDVHVKIPTAIKSSKQVKIKIEKDSLKVAYVDEASSWKNLIDEKLAWKVKVEECTWSLFPGDHIHIFLEKCQERWWENLLINETKLSLKNMNPEKAMSDLDDESQAKIKQMMFDDQQKKLGLPTSEQQKCSDILKQAWDAEGSPFKGTPFDPSVALSMNSNQS